MANPRLAMALFTIAVSAVGGAFIAIQKIGRDMQEADKRLTPTEWLKDSEFKGTIVYDPDGWDRKNFEEDWNRPITRDEMKQKLQLSSTMVMKG